MAAETSWQEIATRTQAELMAKIPKEWLLPESIVFTKQRNIMPIFRSCGLLTERELEITDVEDCVILLDRLHSQEWSALEVTVAFCKRSAIAQQLINPLMDIDYEGAMSRAKELDQHLSTHGKPIGPLHGLPISLKDLTDVKGMHVSLGMVAFADLIADTDAIVVSSLRAAGAVVYCKTTMPQSGMALETVSNLHGRTLNPFNTDLSCGGSSGGEGALNGCHGAPIGIATDIGGSIRAPASFNGLYGIRPSARRFSYKGNARGFTHGQVAILSAIGPVGRSLRDLELILKVWNASEPWNSDPMVVPIPCSPVPTPGKATIGVMYWDKVVMPHPPIQRAMKAVVEKLKSAGHEVVEFTPLKHEEAWDLAFKHYYPTAGVAVNELIEKAGEPLIPAVAQFHERIKPLSVHELSQAFKDQRQYQTEYLAHWNATASHTSSGKPIDALLTPSMASASFPHDYLPWWGYLSQWNLLDYPAIILPVSSVQPTDLLDHSYRPANARDQENHEMYDPQKYADAPVCVQVVGRNLQEEKLLAVARAVDQAIKRA